MIEIDRIYSLTINVGFAKEWLDPWMIALSSKWIWLVFILIWVLLSRKSKRRWTLFAVALFAVSCSDLFAFEVLKPYFGRIRPCREFSYIRQIHSCGGMLSFPSNHAINSFTTAILVAFWERRLIAVPLIIFAMLVSFSRVYLGVHYLGDVIVGGVLGFTWAALLTILISKAPFLVKLKNQLFIAPLSGEGR